MNPDYINALLESTVTVLTTMAMIDVTPGKPAVKPEALPRGDITGQIDLAGEQAHGTLAISFSKPAILDITEKMLGESVDTINDTVVDVVGEITNMITGNAKRLLSEIGIEFDLTLPSTTVGKSRPLASGANGDAVLLPFSTAAGEIYVEARFA